MATLLPIVFFISAGILYKLFKMARAQDNKDYALSRQTGVLPSEPILSFTPANNDPQIISKWAQENGYSEASHSSGGIRHFFNKTLLGQPLVIAIQKNGPILRIFSWVVMNGKQHSVANSPIARFNQRMRKANRDIEILKNLLG